MVPGAAKRASRIKRIIADRADQIRGIRSIRLIRVALPSGVRERLFHVRVVERMVGEHGAHVDLAE